MTYKHEIDVETYNSVGPYRDLHGHGPVTVITRWEMADSGQEVADSVYLCLDCGYTVTQPGSMVHATCDRDRNRINTTWRDAIGNAIDTGDGTQ